MTRDTFRIKTCQCARKVWRPNGDQVVKGGLSGKQRVLYADNYLLFDHYNMAINIINIKPCRTFFFYLEISLFCLHSSRIFALGIEFGVGRFFFQPFKDIHCLLACLLFVLRRPQLLNVYNTFAFEILLLYLVSAV